MIYRFFLSEAKALAAVAIARAQGKQAYCILQGFGTWEVRIW